LGTTVVLNATLAHARPASVVLSTTVVLDATLARVTRFRGSATATRSAPYMRSSERRPRRAALHDGSLNAATRGL
jgi:hypothetical protein